MLNGLSGEPLSESTWYTLVVKNMNTVNLEDSITNNMKYKISSFYNENIYTKNEICEKKFKYKNVLVQDKEYCII